MQSKSKPEVGESLDLLVLDELIQRRIAKAKLQGYPTPSTTKISDSPSPKTS